MACIESSSGADRDKTNSFFFVGEVSSNLRYTFRVSGTLSRKKGAKIRSIFDKVLLKQSPLPFLRKFSNPKT
jgi:hypothetical protein